MKSLTYIMLVIISFLWSCNQQSINPELENYSNEPKGMMELSLDMTNAPPEVVRLEGRLSNYNGEEIYIGFDIDEYYATATVEDIASGIWTLTVDAFDINDNIIYTGTTEVTVYPGTITPVSIHLNPANGSIEITVTWGYEDDQFEDNDQLSDATPLWEYTYYRNLYVSAVDDDWYAMEISADSLSIRCNFIHSNGDIDIDLVDQSGAVIASSQSNTDNENIDHIVNDINGTYYIHVYVSSGINNTYTIWWDDIISESN
jgi:hypothetical protein